MTTIVFRQILNSHVNEIVILMNLASTSIIYSYKSSEEIVLIENYYGTLYLNCCHFHVYLAVLVISRQQRLTIHVWGDVR